jgi:phosphatidylserine/phosphatidylglycerophosphate/cardiolipin synthase-like enzyme
MAADGKRCIIGSINLAPGSFDSRRELAIEVDDEKVIKPLHHIVRHDWERSKPLDLTDEGLLADLKEEAGEAAAMLALEKGEEKGK